MSARSYSRLGQVSVFSFAVYFRGEDSLSLTGLRRTRGCRFAGVKGFGESVYPHYVFRPVRIGTSRLLRGGGLLGGGGGLEGGDPLLEPGDLLGLAGELAQAVVRLGEQVPGELGALTLGALEAVAGEQALDRVEPARDQHHHALDRRLDVQIDVRLARAGEAGLAEGLDRLVPQGAVLAGRTLHLAMEALELGGLLLGGGLLGLGGGGQGGGLGLGSQGDLQDLHGVHRLDEGEGLAGGGEAGGGGGQGLGHGGTPFGHGPKVVGRGHAGQARLRG